MPLQPNNKNNNKQTPSPATLRNPYVKSHNIQSSFLSLTTETAQYREATQQATKERQALQERLQTCRHEIQTSAEEIRAAQDTLGGATREISLWRRQETNVRDKLLRERQVLEELTHTIQELEGTVKYDRCDFCRNMADLNHELGRLLRAHEEARLASFMHPETAATVLMTDENTGGVEEEGGDATPHNNGPDDSPARDEHRDLQAALAALHEAAGVYEDFRAQEENYSQHVVDLRRRILAEGKRTATAAAASRDKFVADGDEATLTEQGLVDLDEPRTDGDEAMLWTEQGLIDMEDAWVKDWEENPPASLYSESQSEGEDSETQDDSEMQDDDGASVTH